MMYDNTVLCTFGNLCTYANKRYLRTCHLISVLCTCIPCMDKEQVMERNMNESDLGIEKQALLIQTIVFCSYLADNGSLGN